MCSDVFRALSRRRRLCLSRRRRRIRRRDDRRRGYPPRSVPTTSPGDARPRASRRHRAWRGTAHESMRQRRGRTRAAVPRARAGLEHGGGFRERDQSANPRQRGGFGSRSRSRSRRFRFRSSRSRRSRSSRSRSTESFGSRGRRSRRSMEDASGHRGMGRRAAAMAAFTRATRASTRGSPVARRFRRRRTRRAARSAVARVSRERDGADGFASGFGRSRGAAAKGAAPPRGLVILGLSGGANSVSGGSRTRRTSHARSSRRRRRRWEGACRAENHARCAREDEGGGRGRVSNRRASRRARVASSRFAGTHPAAKRRTTAASVVASSDGARTSDTDAIALGAVSERPSARASADARIPHCAARARSDHDGSCLFDHF